MSEPGHAGGHAGLSTMGRKSGLSSVNQNTVRPPESAEGLGDLQLGDVVEHAPRSVDLGLAVAGRVPGEAQARRELVGEAEVDRGRRDVRVVGQRGHVLVLGPQPHLQREPAAERPFVLQEQADVVHRRLAGDDEAAIGQEVVAHDRVVAVRSRNAIERLPPEEVDHVARQARERVDPDAIELHAALYLVPAGRGERDRPVHLER